jgi:hypothetical protein
MIKLIDNLPDNILAIQATGRVTSDDYQTIVAPATDALRASHNTLRLLYHIPPEFKKFSTTALWDDAHIGLYRLHGFERVAVVTDVEWIKSLANEIRRSGATEIRIFAHAEFDEACNWICA